jgi:hypothetical protein
MKYAALTVALFAAGGSMAAHAERTHVHTGCDISSQYSLSTNRLAFVFTRRNGEPGEIGLGGGRLFIDGKEASLSAADHQRLGQFEKELHLLVPEVQKVAVEAVEIAFTALTEVARGLASDPDATVARLDAAHKRAHQEMTDKPLTVFNDEAMGDMIKPIITQYVPEIVGGAVSSGLKAAFGGEQKAKEFEARMNRMEHELDTKVDARANALEPLADAMCQRLRRMDDIDNSLEFRLPDGAQLQLLRVDHHEKN